MPGMQNTMSEWKDGALHSGSKDGPVVHNQAQAVAIGLHEQDQAKPTSKHPRRRRRKHKGPAKQAQAGNASPPNFGKVKAVFAKLRQGGPDAAPGQ